MTKRFTWYRPFVPYVVRRIKQKSFDDSIYQNTAVEANVMSWLDNRIHEWCVANQFLLAIQNTNAMGKMIDGTRIYVPNITDDNTSIVDKIFNRNFRTLTSEKECQAFTDYLHDTQADFTFNNLLRLHIEIASRANTKALETHMTKLYTSLQQFSDMSDDTSTKTYLSWPTIHEMYPFMWLLYEIQQYMHRYKNTTS